MPKAHDPCREHPRLRPLIELALREGWDVSRTDGHLMFIKQGFPPVFTGSMALAQLHRIGTPGDWNA